MIGESDQQARRFKQLLALDGELDKATPKSLLYRRSLCASCVGSSTPPEDP
ncbi:hypothetical protein [Streptomyces sp. 061-3]|uniref:hypothetical protein n=1 Tax=Streptomyces sp. 061-3 TaxID=2789268 RepID=UPI0039804C73